MIASLEDWFAAGERIPLRITSSAGVDTHDDFHLFCRIAGAGEWITFLHGFPTCSWDWNRIAPALQSGYHLLMFDFLGFGDSDKPPGHRYSLLDQADLTQALWRVLGVQQTSLVAHDYGDTVALELLHRQEEGRLSTAITRCLLMNAGLYVDLQQPVLAQKLLLNPFIGPLLDRFLGESFFTQQFKSVFSSAHPISDQDVHQYWRSVTRHRGLRNFHRLIFYMQERRLYQARWERVLEHAVVPIRFLWGLDDPVSGKHISDHIRQRIPGADLVEFPGVGHYPQLEVPTQISQEMIHFLGGQRN